MNFIRAKSILETVHAALAGALFLCLATTALAGMTVANLRCDYAVNPLGVDPANPRLFWKLEGAARGLRQTAYQILAAVPQIAVVLRQFFF